MMSSSLTKVFSILGFWSPGQSEMLLLLVIALILYGGKLPEVARSWGKTFAEFRRSWSGIQQEFNDVLYSEPAKLEYRDDDSQPAGYVESSDAYMNDPVDGASGETSAEPGKEEEKASTTKTATES